MQKLYMKSKYVYGMWIALGIVSCLYFFTLYYWDIRVTYKHSLIFLDCIKQGQLFDFYEITVQNQEAVGAVAVYTVPIYVVFAIWNIPVWFLTRYFSFDVDGIFCLLWSKGIVIAFVIGTIYMFYIILKKLNYEHVEYILFLFSSSLLLFIPALAVAQYDIIQVFFLFWGIYLYILDEKLSFRVLLLFSIAISIKFFAVFPFLILVLVAEKNLFKIILNLIYGFLFSIITILPWYSGYISAGAGFTKGWLFGLFGNVIQGGIADISVFAVGMCAIFIIAYILEKEQTKERVRFVFWLSAAFFLLFFSTVYTNPYWIIMLLPYVCPMLAEQWGNLRVNMILEVIMEWAIIIVQGVIFHWVYFAEGGFASLIMKGMNDKLQNGATNMYNVFEKLEIMPFVPGFYTVFIVCGVALLILNNPWKPLKIPSLAENIHYVELCSRVARVSGVFLYWIVTFIIAYVI